MSEAARPSLVPRLALADLRHEAVGTFCMTAALAVILAPLLILLGLRYGAIEMLRERLVQNPSYRAVWPTATHQLDAAWFAATRARPEVAFLLPTILRGASVIGARKPGEARRQDLDLIPTATGDPLLESFGLAAPRAGEVVLARPAAEKLGVAAGQMLELEVDRQREGRRERQPVSVRVAGVLPFEADDLERLYAPFELAEAVERWREGLAVPELGWPGGTPRPHHAFDGVLIVLPQPLGAVDLLSLPPGTGFPVVEETTAETFTELTGLPAPPGRALYRAVTLTQPALLANVEQLRNKLRGRGAVLLPHVRPFEVELAPGRTERVVGLSIGPDEAAVLGVEPTPWGRYEAGRGGPAVARITLPAPPAGSERLELALPGLAVGRASLEVAGASPVATVPLELAAALRTGAARRLAWDAERREPVLERSGYTGFRLYTRTIDQVPALYRELTAQGLRVDARVQEIERIQVLDRGLLRLFLLIAGVGAVGGGAALFASLWAAVERKRRELGVMRLMGLTRAAVARFPLVQGLALATLGVLLASLIYGLVAALINVSFADAVAAGGRLCRLPPAWLGSAFLASLGVALVSSLAAARRATAIDPAEAIREE